MRHMRNRYRKFNDFFYIKTIFFKFSQKKIKIVGDKEPAPEINCIIYLGF